ncbi:GAF domain-containing protein [Gemmatimonas sp.]
MSDIELMDLFPQFASVTPESAPRRDAVAAARQDRGRLREIAALRLTEPDVGRTLEDICREASKSLGLPMSFVSIVLDEAQHFAAQHGVGGWLGEAGGTPVEWSFCQYSVAAKQGFVVEDAARHMLVQDSPLVTQDGVRCYAGMPLVTTRGFAVGTLCVAGPDTHVFTESDLQTLRRYAGEAVRRIETRRVEITP